MSRGAAPRDRSLEGLAIEARTWAAFFRAFQRPEGIASLQRVGLDPLPTAERLDAYADRAVVVEDAANAASVARTEARAAQRLAVAAVTAARPSWRLLLLLEEPAPYTAARAWWAHAVKPWPRRPTTYPTAMAELERLRVALRGWPDRPGALTALFAELNTHAAALEASNAQVAEVNARLTAAARAPLAAELGEVIAGVQRRFRLARRNDPKLPLFEAD